MNVERSFGVFGNSRGCKVFRLGSLLLLGPMNGGDERVRVLGLDRGKKFTCIYREISNIKTLRVKYVPHRFYKHPGSEFLVYEELAMAEEQLAGMTERCP